ncbi:MAG: hypothetical protein FWG82_04600 [Oscillospiraceae bacterium]|nr:hypothetical protein [Oscillospiraceae bacterium]
MRRVTKTDNKSVANKVFLRRKATEHLDGLYVLDLFAGNNILWRGFDKERYFGVELVSGKGSNLTADAKKIIDSLDLSQFNVIDCDSYGIPFEICRKLFENKRIKSETVIIYTAITNIFTQLPNECINILGIDNMYKQAPSLFNTNAIMYFYEMLAKYSVREVNYYEVIDAYIKHYGYFLIP